MWLEQAVFTSSRTRRGEGYHVVAKSPGISDDIVVALTRWCPSHASLQSSDVNAESLNFHPLIADRVVVSRSTYGLKEFSGRGGLQVVTTALVMRRSQLLGYENNAFRLARVVRSLGHLRWRPHFDERLAAIELPKQEMSESLVAQHSAISEANIMSATVADMLRAGQRVAVGAESETESGAGQLQLAEEIVQRLSIDLRAGCYFTTALKWSKQRAFRLQMLNSIDAKIRILLKSHHIQAVVREKKARYDRAANAATAWSHGREPMDRTNP